jgi:hypothetical protein
MEACFQDGVGLGNYKFGRKNNWRRWAWNQGKKRICCKPKDAVVIYLPSRQNLDEDVALSKGFDRRNLFAVERDKDIVKALRKTRANVIASDLSKTVMVFGEEPKVDLIMADFCCGLTKTAQRFAKSLLLSRAIHSGGKRTVVVANFLRGRDENFKFTNGDSIFEIFNRGVKLNGLGSEYLKHRGAMFIYCVLFCFGWALLENYGVACDDAESFMIKYVKDIKANGKPLINTYKSENGSVMDSISFSITRGIEFTKPLDLGSEDLKETQRMVAAAKAHRTMRINKR